MGRIILLMNSELSRFIGYGKPVMFLPLISKAISQLPSETACGIHTRTWLLASLLSVGWRAWIWCLRLCLTNRAEVTEACHVSAANIESDITVAKWDSLWYQNDTNTGMDIVDSAVCFFMLGLDFWLLCWMKSLYMTLEIIFIYEECVAWCIRS